MISQTYTVTALLTTLRIRFRQKSWFAEVIISSEMPHWLMHFGIRVDDKICICWVQLTVVWVFKEQVHSKPGVAVLFPPNVPGVYLKLAETGDRRWLCGCVTCFFGCSLEEHFSHCTKMQCQNSSTSWPHSDSVTQRIIRNRLKCILWVDLSPTLFEEKCAFVS